MRIPKVPAGDKQMKGRPIVLEEHERMLAAVGKVVAAPYVPLWRRYLTGLWWSGLRLGESASLSWEPSADVSVVMQPGYHPAIRFRPGGHKARRAELAPCAPEFAEMLEAVPEADRTGHVFPLQRSNRTRRQLSADWVGLIVSQIGEKAGVVVDGESGKFASAHDFRRSFGTRWSKRVLAPRLKRLMRHRDINTTLKYYVDEDVEDISADLWDAYEKVPNTSRNSRLEMASFAGDLS